MTGKKIDGKGCLWVVSGPSGSGKSTLCRELVGRTGIRLSVSATTRPRGDGELEGRDYFFLSEKAFAEKIEQEEFLEYANVFGHYYGTPRGPVEKALREGKSVVLEIDIQGAEQVFERFGQSQGVLILPPSDEELQRRLARRGRDDEKAVEKRLAKAQWEIEQARKCGHYAYTIINDDLGKAIDELTEIINRSTS